MTMTTDPPLTLAAVGGWSCLQPRLIIGDHGVLCTDLTHLWNGVFTAACPCGRTVNWDARTHQPLCTCPPPGRNHR